MENEILEDNKKPNIENTNSLSDSEVSPVEEIRYEDEPQLPKKNIIKIVAIVSMVGAVILVVIAISAIIFWNSSKKEEVKEVVEEDQEVKINWLSHQDLEHKFKIKYPSDWRKEEKTEYLPVLFFPPTEGFKDNLNIPVQDLTAWQPMDLQKFTDLSIEQVENMIPSYSFISLEDIMISGIPGKKIVYTGKMSNENLKWMQVWTVDGNEAYVITYTAKISSYSDSIDAVEKMIDSFEIIE